MRYPDSNPPPDSPSSLGHDAVAGPSSHNGHSKQATASSVARVTLPGSALYDDADVDREEFVRLVIQSLRDVGYIESAATLEAESGYAMEAPEVTDFRRYILEARWAKAEAALQRLGVRDREGLWDARFLISQQKYLELLEAQKTTDALQVLRNELAPLDDLRQRAGWDGAAGDSRRILLDNLHRYIPPSIMIPSRRFATLLHQANAYQRQQCVYHNVPTSAPNFSLFADHQCDKTGFPRVTTTILEVHSDEVWTIAWSHDGNFLASASKDKTGHHLADRGPAETSIREWEKHHALSHAAPVLCLAWSLNDEVLLAGADQHIKMWNTKTGVLIRAMEGHGDDVTSLLWLPDDSGFLWQTDGTRQDVWSMTPVRVTGFAVTPDFSRLVAIGMHSTSPVDSRPESGAGTPSGNGGGATPGPPPKDEHRMLVFDMASKRLQSSTLFEGELTSVKVSQNSQYALISCSPDDIQLWDLNLGRLVRKYTGQRPRQTVDIIQSCFGGFDGSFVVSGGEDGNVYVWHRDTGVLLEVLEGHAEGSVNCVAWNPRNERMFASCSDDHTIRIWEAPPPEMGMLLDSPTTAEYPLTVPKGKGKTRQRWEGDGADGGGSTARI
ncbi:WD40 repeat-like protein [Mycena rebaudengoi]|nr:WD40 repeat-like protein [Mycena rebaudengoi]